VEVDFKDAIFIFEMAQVPEDLKVMQGIANCFRGLPETASTLVETADNLDGAAQMIDQFKNKMCGSAYSLAIINLNLMSDVREVEFLLRRNILGDPRTIFMASLKYMVGDAYAFARDKVQRESQTMDRSPSCIYRYGSANRTEIYQPVAEVAVAYLREAEEALKKQPGVYRADTHATKLLRKSETAFIGNRLHSGMFSAGSETTTSGRYPKLGSSPGGGAKH
jgi:hypothetical protein